MSIDTRVDRIVKLLDEKKAENIEVFDLRDTDYIVKEVVIADSMGGKHTFALFDYMKERLKPLGEEFISADESEDWIVVDLGDILVHLMTPAYRRKYDIEEFLSSLSKDNSIE